MCQGSHVTDQRPLARAICRGWLHIHPMFHKQLHITQTCSSIVVDSSAKRPRHTFPASDISAVEMRDWRAAATACAGDALVAAAVGRNASNNWSCGGGVARAPPQRLPALFSRVGAAARTPRPKRILKTHVCLVGLENLGLWLRQKTIKNTLQ